MLLSYKPEAFSQCRDTHPPIYIHLHKTEVAVKFLKKKFRNCLENGPKSCIFFHAASDANLHMPTKKLYTLVYSEILPLHYFELGLLFYGRFHHAKLLPRVLGVKLGPHTCGKYISHWAASSALGSYILKDCFL